VLQRACEAPGAAEGHIAGADGSVGVGGARVREFDWRVLEMLSRKGLVHFEVPVTPGDKFSIPPLEVGRWMCGRLAGSWCGAVLGVRRSSLA